MTDAFDSEHGEAVLPKASDRPGSVEALEAERDKLRVALTEPCAECGHIDWRSDGYADSFFDRVQAAEVGRDQAIEERDEARQTLRKIKALADFVVAGAPGSMRRLPLALAIANLARSALAGVPGGPKAEEQDLGGTAVAVPGSETDSGPERSQKGT